MPKSNHGLKSIDRLNLESDVKSSKKSSSKKSNKKKGSKYGLDKAYK